MKKIFSLLIIFIFLFSFTLAEPSISVHLKNSGDIYYGDIVTLRADVSDAPEEYSIYWEASSDGSSWFSVGSDSSYSFTVNEENALYYYRAILEVSDGDSY